LGDESSRFPVSSANPRPIPPSPWAHDTDVQRIEGVLAPPSRTASWFARIWNPRCQSPLDSPGIWYGKTGRHKQKRWERMRVESWVDWCLTRFPPDRTKSDGAHSPVALGIINRRPKTEPN
jgi:hypothetical protein